MAKEQRVGIIGYGRMGQHHAEVWSQIPGVKIAGVAEPLGECRRSAKTRHGCKVFSDSYQMLDIIRPDIAIIATHVPLHAQHVRFALLYDCHVVCEKPMACTLLQCDAMIAEARRRNVKIAIHHQSIFSRAFATANEMIVSGTIGELQMMRAYGKGRIACSDLMEIGGHLVHGMRYLAAAEPTSVYGDVTIKGMPMRREDAKCVQDLYPAGRDSGIGAGDRMIGLYTFANGMRGELYLSQTDGAPSTYNEDRNFGYYIDIFGSRERLQLYLPRVLFRNRSPYDDLSKAATPWEEINQDFRNDRDPILTRIFAEDFLRSIEDDTKPVISGTDGRITMEMIIGIYASHFAGKPLAIPLQDKSDLFRE